MNILGLVSGIVAFTKSQFEEQAFFVMLALFFFSVHFFVHFRERSDKGGQTLSFIAVLIFGVLAFYFSVSVSRGDTDSRRSTPTETETATRPPTSTTVEAVPTTVRTTATSTAIPTTQQTSETMPPSGTATEKVIISFSIDGIYTIGPDMARSCSADEASCLQIHTKVTPSKQGCNFEWTLFREGQSDPIDHNYTSCGLPFYLGGYPMPPGVWRLDGIVTFDTPTESVDPSPTPRTGGRDSYTFTLVDAPW